MGNKLNHRGIEMDTSASFTETGIYEKVRKRMKELGSQTDNAASFCRELNPDVIVISDDQSLLFEPQSTEVTEWLGRRFRLNLKIRDRIRVHPCQRHGIIAELKAAGFGVVL